MNPEGFLCYRSYSSPEVVGLPFLAEMYASTFWFTVFNMSSSGHQIINESSSKRECIDVGKITATDHHQPSSSSSSWQVLPKDSRIVRVARSLGGKDRHSKVCTVRGLRDRRVRLSVQTAIQLYNLQDRLGFNQPSKVVDWLLEAAQEDINKLPPLQIPVENLAKFAQPMLVEPGHEMTTSSFGVEKDTWKPDAQMMKNVKNKQSLGKETNWLKICSEKENHINSHSRTSQPTLDPGFVNNDIVPYPSFYQWDHSPSSSYFSYMGGSTGLPLQTEVEGNSTLSSNAMTKSISLSSSAGSQVLYQYPSMLPFVCPTTMDSDPKNMTNHNIVQMLNHPNISQNYLLQ